MPSRSVRTLEEAVLLLRELGAPPRLTTHAALVSEAAELLLQMLSKRKVTVDRDWVRAGGALHDAGKIRHPQELHGLGANHEPDGEQLLLSVGVAPHIARCCLSHARWGEMECSLEELLVALADKLWKGVRHPELEKRVIELVATRRGTAFWDEFIPLDSCFEAVAAEAPARLERSG